MSQFIYFECLSSNQLVQSIPYDSNYTIAQIYQYVSQILRNLNFYITLDGKNELQQQDYRTLAILKYVPDTIIYIHQISILNVFFKLNEYTFKNLQQRDTMQIQQILQQFIFEIQKQNVMIDNIEIFIMDQYTYQYPINSINQQQQFCNLFPGQNQITFLAIQKIQPQIIPQIPIGQILLEQLIIFENFSLIIDPTEKVVGYKFHFPYQISGYLSEEKGKPRDKIKSFNYMNCDWKDLQKIKYTSIINGFAICWENGSINSVQISIL